MLGELPEIVLATSKSVAEKSSFLIFSVVALPFKVYQYSENFLKYSSHTVVLLLTRRSQFQSSVLFPILSFQELSFLYSVT
jgi:hypothetical protein